MAIWFPRDSTIKIDKSSDVTITNATVLDTAFASATEVTATQKGITITPAMPSVDIIQTMGVTAQNTTEYQNAEMEEKPPGLFKIAGTIIHQKDESGYELEIFGTGTAAGATHTTYEPGKATPTKVAMLFNLDDGTDEVNYAARNLVFTQWEISPTGADGHFEIAFEAYCLPKDMFGPQFKN